MHEEPIEAGVKIDRIPTKERNVFQILLMQSMLGEQPINKTKKEWNEEKIKWLETYAKTISDIIDNVKYKEIRYLIMVGKYTEAAVLVIKMLGEEKIKEAA